MIAAREQRPVEAAMPKTKDITMLTTHKDLKEDFFESKGFILRATIMMFCEVNARARIAAIYISHARKESRKENQSYSGSFLRL